MTRSFKTNQCGRSIFEMLLVIAIMAVLCLGIYYSFKIVNIKVQSNTLEKAIDARVLKARHHILITDKKNTSTEIGPGGIPITTEIPENSSEFFSIVVGAEGHPFKKELCDELLKSATFKPARTLVNGMNGCQDDMFQANFYFFKYANGAIDLEGPNRNICLDSYALTCDDLGNALQCIEGYYLKSDTKKCTQCEEKRTTCKSSETEPVFQPNTGNQCIIREYITCPEDKPDCNEDTGECILATPCLAGQHRNGVSCDNCTGRTYSEEGATSCTPCDAGKEANTDHTACINCTDTTTIGACGCTGKYADGEGGCCPEHSSTTETSSRIGTSACYCDVGYEVSGNSCVPCTDTTTEGACGCTGKYADGEGGCCPEHSSTDVVTGNLISGSSCYCKLGYQVSGSSCSECPSTTTCLASYTQGTCMVAHQDCETGVCWLKTGECIESCWSGYVASKGFCCLRTTPFWNGTECTACPDNSDRTIRDGKQIDDTICYCKAGYKVNEEQTGCERDACDGNACCLEMLSLGFEIDPDCTRDKCWIEASKTIQKNNTFFMMGPEYYESDFTPYPFYKGDITLNKDIKFNTCDTLFIKGGLTLNADLEIDDLDVTKSIVINSNKNLTVGMLDSPAITVESGATLTTRIDPSTHDGDIYLAGPAPNGYWEEAPSYENLKLINRGTVRSAEGIKGAGTIENYGSIICQKKIEIAHSLDLINDGHIKATDLFISSNLQNNGILELSGDIETDNCTSINATCQKSLTNAGTITGSSLRTASLRQTGGTISISGNAQIGYFDYYYTKKPKGGDLAIDILGGDVTIGGNLNYTAIKAGIKLSGKSNMTVNGEEEFDGWSWYDLTEGPGIEVSDGSTLIINGGSLTPPTSPDIGIKLVGNNSKIKVKGHIQAVANNYSIWQTGGEIIACGDSYGNGISSDSSLGIYITGGAIRTPNVVSTCFRASQKQSCTKDFYYWSEPDEYDPNNEQYNPRIFPYSDVSWCNGAI